DVGPPGRKQVSDTLRCGDQPDYGRGVPAAVVDPDRGQFVLVVWTLPLDVSGDSAHSEELVAFIAHHDDAQIVDLAGEEHRDLPFGPVLAAVWSPPGRRGAPEEPSVASPVPRRRPNVQPRVGDRTPLP